MARIRSIKPDFWEDEQVGLWSPLARLLFIGSWNLADDEGLLRWTADYLNASLFMYDSMPTSRIVKLMEEIEGPGAVFVYRGGKSGSQALAYIVNFRKHQVINRPQPSKLPPPSLQSVAVLEMYGHRDKWTCHLCKGPINREKVTIIDPYSNGEESPGLNLSIDHLKPRVQGGTDHPSNLRAAHRSCNRGRRDRPIEEFTPPERVVDAVTRNGSMSRSLNVSMNAARTSQQPITAGSGSGSGSGNYGSQSSVKPYTDQPCGKPDDDLKRLAQARQIAQAELDDYLTAQARKPELPVIVDEAAWLAKVTRKHYDQMIAADAPTERCGGCGGRGTITDGYGEPVACPACRQDATT